MKEEETKPVLSVEYYLLHGLYKTLNDFNLTEETFNRYKRAYIKSHPEFDFKAQEYLLQIKEKFGLQELKAIAKTGAVNPTILNRVDHNFKGDEITFGVMSDLHLGSIYTSEALLDITYEEFDKRNVDFVVMPGDLTEGMSNRPDHIYQVHKIGYDQQKEYAIEQLNKFKKKMYIIDGNHDRWFLKSNGALIVKDICNQVEHAEFIGHDQGDINLKGAIVRLFHGEDGSAYAISYRVQKIIEAFSGGEKPSMIVTGHDHKQGHFFIRNIHVIMAGCIEKQSAWMRSKKMAAHVGFWIIKLCVGDGMIKWIEPRWYPYYE